MYFGNSTELSLTLSSGFVINVARRTIVCYISGVVTELKTVQRTLVFGHKGGD
jgi:hypothetical protein